MEKKFGYDFTNVKVHDDLIAAESARAINALAFTYANHIFFNTGQYSTNSDSGKKLLAHELTHVIQQQGQKQANNKIAGTDISPVQSDTPVIQRFSYLESIKVHQVNNLAQTVLEEKDVGFTYFLLNGVRIQRSSDTRRALKKPTLNVSPAKGGGFDAKVAHVPVNKGAIDETVLSPGNWKQTVPKSHVFSKFPKLSACRSNGYSVFSAIGDPSDLAVFEANRRHEDRHVHDYFSIFMDTIYRWDTELDIAAAGSLDAATPFHGNTRQEAESALYKAMGGTPDEIADKFTDASKKAQDDFHNTPEGGFVSWDPDEAVSDANCNISSVKVINPS